MDLITRKNNNLQNQTLLPPGVVPNYVDPPSIGGRIVWSGPLVASLALCFVLMRVYIKVRIIKKWSWGDTFIIIAMILAIGRVVMDVWIVKTAMLGRHNWDIPPSEFAHAGNRGKNGMFIGDMMYFIGILFTKLSILMMYLHVFKVYRWFRWLCYSMMALVICYPITFVFIWAFGCTPVARVWNLVGWEGGGSCIDMVKVGFVAGGINLATDAIIFVMPMPLLAKLQITNARKLGLIAIFATGILSVVICTIIRQVIMVQTYQDYDQNWHNVYTITWLTAEFCVGIMCACMPSLAPIYTRNLLATIVPESVRRYLRPLRSWGSSTNVRYRSSKGNASPTSPTPPRSTASDIELVDKQHPGDIHQTTTIDISSMKSPV
ncbi:hypothetical protein K491DRAFT_588154 [Lophiostoma macrostomum CBS 122681]|uniref:Rhodopsin domain-containing protein n=1 Tax=Lophiostoma macrostomum CBS 122681 TaxID=1314788 RepID=A0A6A6TR08_9PLEO|nr:hypothetical protein K491DRAFT_588154 [Lophiostoma macrostomum CBS 122681]